MYNKSIGGWENSIIFDDVVDKKKKKVIKYKQHNKSGNKTKQYHNNYVI